MMFSSPAGLSTIQGLLNEQCFNLLPTSISILFPEEFIKRISSQSYIEADKLLRSLSEPAPVSIRVNTGKWDHVPAGSEPVPWSSSGYYLKSRPSYTADPLFHAGCYYPQEASSMFIEEVYRQVAGETRNIRVLDLCGAPGGKSTLLSSLIGRNGVLIANEVIRQRAAVLSENITKWGLGNTIVTSSDPSAFTKMRGYFDIILVDAPCSGEGMFRDETAVREWSPQNAALCSERQRRIVSNVWPSLKADGVLIYSTCTFNPAENEENILWLTEQQDASSVAIDISRFGNIKKISLKTIEGYGFHPGNIQGDGLFISVVKKGGGDHNRSTFPSKTAIRNSSKEEISIASKFTDADPSKLYSNNDYIMLVPVPAEEFAFLSSSLGIIKAGTDLFRVRGKDSNPLHDLALYTGAKHDAFPSFEADHNLALSYLRRESFRIEGMPDGWVIVRYRGVNLGFVKNIGLRINNYYPVEWRIRMAAGTKNTTPSISWE
jgi:16S rRNA C967 or C1407 C5-methylase (RsmB/RsmF family)/NOL1/NOP2/fmu family ribosome biogenesis protein